MTAPANLIGQRFGRLIVLERAESRFDKAHWSCKCDCGNMLKKSVSTGSLRSGHVRSCGCLFIETATQTGYGKAVHKAHGTRLCRIWCGMKSRCYYTGNIAYKNYGGRGITVCEKWIHDFLVFRDWALTHGYTEELTIDRKDNNGNYSPENCKWSTPKEQANNTRYNVRITHEGQTKTVAEWSEILGVRRSIIYHLVAKKKPLDDIFSTVAGE